MSKCCSYHLKHQNILIRIFQNGIELSLEFPVVHRVMFGKEDMKVYEKM